MFGLGYDIIEILAIVFLLAGFAVSLSGWVFKSAYINLFRPNRAQWMVLLAGGLFLTGVLFFGVAIGPKAKQAWVAQHPSVQTPEMRK